MLVNRVQFAADQRAKPKTLQLTIAEEGLRIGNHRAGLQDDKVWGIPGGRLIFTVQNNTNRDYEVRIPSNEVVPSAKFAADATPEPLEPSGGQVLVPAGDIEVVQHRVKRAAHFDFKRRLGQTYKFNVYWGPAGTKMKCVDPDIEINEP